MNSSNYIRKILLIYILFMFVIFPGSCVLNKMSTKISVYDEFEESGKLEISTKLSYINLDTGETLPIPGKEMTIILNVTKKDGENEEIVRDSLTNSGGWVKRTYYLEDVKSYTAKVTYNGDGSYKSAVGTLSGSGGYEQVSYATNLPDGVSLTTCMPLLLLFGFLGAAMYASGGNPFGFIDLTPSRGFKMNRNLRKGIFTQSWGMMVVGSVALVLKEVIEELAKGEEVEVDGEGGEKGKDDEEEEGEVDKKVPASLMGVRGASGKSNKSYKKTAKKAGVDTTEKASTPSPTAEGETVSLQDTGKKGGKGSLIKERSEDFHKMADVLLALLSMISGTEFVLGRTRIVAAKHTKWLKGKAKQKLQEERLKSTTLEGHLGNERYKGHKAEEASKIEKTGLKLLKYNLKKFQKQLKEGKRNGKPLTKEGVREIKQQIKNTKGAIKERESNIKRIGKEIKKCEEKINTLNNLIETHGGSKTLNEISHLIDNAESYTKKRELEKDYKEINEAIRAETVSGDTYAIYDDYKGKENLEVNLKNEKSKNDEKIGDSGTSDEERKKLEERNKEIDDEIKRIDNNIFFRTTEEQVANVYANSEESIEEISKKVDAMEKQAKEVEMASKEANKNRDEEYNNVRSDLVIINYLANNDEKREEVQNIHDKEQRGETLTTQEKETLNEYKIMFDPERQKEVLGYVSSTNIMGESFTSMDEIVNFSKNIERNMMDKIEEEIKHKNLSEEEQQKIRDKMGGKAEELAALARDLTPQLDELDHKIRYAEEGSMDSFEQFKLLNPNSDNFSKQYKDYEKLRAEEEGLKKKENELGIFNTNNYTLEVNKENGYNPTYVDKWKYEDKEKEKLAEKIENNLKYETMKYEKRATDEQVKKMVDKYEIMDNSDENKQRDRNNKKLGEIDKKIEENIEKKDKEIGRENKRKEEYSGTAPKTKREEKERKERDANIKRLEKERKELEEQQKRLRDIGEKKEETKRKIFDEEVKRLDREWKKAEKEKFFDERGKDKAERDSGFV